MSYSGAGVFNINSAGQPVVAATTISSTVFNAFTADIATGLSTAICKDGQTTTTASIPFVVGIAVTTGITTPSTTFALVNTTATTVNFAGAASVAINAGHASGTTTWLGAFTLSSTFTLSGTAANIALGSNFISYGGTDAGFSLDASNNATFSANVAIGASACTFNGTNGNSVIGGTLQVGSTVTFTTGNINLTSSASILVFNPGGTAVRTGQMYRSNNSEVLHMDTSGVGDWLSVDLNSRIVTMAVYGAGAATFSAAGVISSVSDENFKIKDGTISDPIPMLMALEPGYFYGKPEAHLGPDRQLGFYAQNVRKAIGPEAAPDPVGGRPWGYFDRSVLAVVVEAVKRHESRFAALEARH